MNSTYRVVFNKARGALMVVNELTKSVQKKGTKTVVAAGVAVMATASLHAATVANVIWSADQTPQANIIEATPKLPLGPNNSPAALYVGKGASGTLTDAKISMVANDESHPYPPAVRALFQFSGNDDKVTFDGASTTITQTTNYTGSGNSEASAFTNYGGQTEFAAADTTLMSEATYAEGGKYVVAVEAYGDSNSDAQIRFTGNTVTLKATSNVDRITNSTDANRRGAVVGATAIYGGITSTAQNNTIIVTSTGETAMPSDQQLNADGKNYTTAAPNGKVGAADACGLEASGGQINLANKTTLTVNANGGMATGISASDAYYTSTTGNVELDGAGIVLEDAVINVTSQKAKASGIIGSQKVSNAVLVNVKGNLDLTVTSEGAQAQVVSMAGGFASLGADGKVVNITANSKNSRGVVADQGATIDLKGKSISVNAADESGRAVAAYDGGTINLGNENTDSVEVNGNFSGIIALAKNSKVNVVSKKIVVNSTNFGVHVQNNTEETTAPDGAASIKLKADEITVNSKSLGLSAFSNGQMDVNGNLTVTAENAIDVRGNSTMNINTDGKHTTVLNGDVVFETPNEPGNANQSGKYINAYVNLGLHGEGSVWTGRAYQYYSVNGNPIQSVELEAPPYHGNVTGFKTEISNGGKWVVNGDSFVNTLNLLGNATVTGNADVKTFNTGTITVTGSGNQLLFEHGTNVNGQIFVKENADLTTRVDTAFNATLSGDIVTAAGSKDANGQSFLVFEQGSTLHIDDAVKYTNAAVEGMSTAYGNLNLVLDNGALHVEDGATDRTMNIPTNVTANLTAAGSADLAGGADQFNIAGIVNVKADVTGQTPVTTVTLSNVSVNGTTQKSASLNLDNLQTTAKTLSVAYGTVSLKGETASLTVVNLTNAGTIDATGGTLTVTGTFDNTDGKITAQNFAVANGTDANIDGIQNLTILDAGSGMGFTVNADHALDDLLVNEKGKLAIESTVSAKTLANAGTLTAAKGLSAGTLGNAGTFTTAQLTAKEAVNEGTMTVTGTADVAALTNTGSFKADSLTVANGSETGTFEVKTLNVKGGTFTLGEGHAVETLNVADASTVKAADMIDVDTLQVEVGGELSAKTLSVASGYDNSTANDVTKLIVKSSDKGFALEQDRVIDAVDVEAGAKLTVKKLDAKTLTGKGSLTASDMVFGEANNFAGFTGDATLSGGRYAMTNDNAERWFGGAVTMTGGTMDVTAMTDAEAALANLTVNGGSLAAYSGQIFENALSDTTFVTDSGAQKTGATLTAGTLTIEDAAYNIRYAGKAGEALKGMTLVFTGRVVSEPDPETPPVKPSDEDLSLDQIADDSLAADNNVIFDTALDTTKGENNPNNLIIGSGADVEEDSTHLTDDASVVNKNIGVTQVKLSEGAELVAVNNNRKLTLIGESGADNLIVSAGGSIKLEVGGQQTAGIVALGVNSDKVANTGTLNVDTHIGEKGVLEVNAGSFTASKVIDNDGRMLVKADASLKIGGDLNLRAGSETTVDGRLETSADKTVTIQTGSTLALNGEALFHKINVEQVSQDTTAHAVITVGNEQSAGKAVIKELVEGATSHLTFFLDPAWVEGGSNPMDAASSLVLDTAAFDGTMIVGRNSYAVFGTEADEGHLLETFKRAGLVWGPKDTTALAYVPHALDLGTDGKIVVDGSLAKFDDFDVTKVPQDVKVAANGVLMIQAQNDLITGTNALDVVFDQDAKLVVDGVKASETPYTFFGDNAVLTHNNAEVLATNAFFELKWVGANGVEVVLNTTDNAYSGLMQGMNLAASAMNQPGTDAYKYADDILSAYGTDRAKGAAAFDAAMNTAGAAAVFTTAYDRASEFRDAVRGEAGKPESNRLWAQVTGGKTKLKGLSTGAQSLHVDTDAYGLVVGGDAALGNAVVGGAFTAGTGDSENDDVGVKDDFNFYGLSVYGKTAVGGVDILADGSMTWVKSDLTMGGVADVDTDTTTTVYSLGVQAQKTFNLAVDVTPFIGMDIYHVRSDGYDNGHGAHVDDSDATAVEFPIGATIAKAFDANGFKVSPNFTFAVVPTVGDRDIDSKVRFAGAESTYNFTFADDVKIRTNLGVAAEKDNFRFGLNAGYDWGNEERSATKLMLNARYLF